MEMENCCVLRRRGVIMCASCGALLEARQCRTTLRYGLVTRFCGEDCLLDLYLENAGAA